MSTPSPLKDRVRAALRETPSPTRAELQVRQRWLALAAGALVLGTACLNGLASLPHKPLLHVATAALAMGAVAVATTRALARVGTAPRVRLLARVNGLVLPLLVLAALLANLAAPETLAVDRAPQLDHLGCAALDLVVGGCVALLGLLALRGADPRSPRRTAAAVGAVAGAWMCLAVTLKCSLTDPLHVLGTHVAPVALLMLLAARFGARIVGLTKLHRSSVPSRDP